MFAYGSLLPGMSRAELNVGRNTIHVLVFQFLGLLATHFISING
ncbi:MAG: hypothetical protein ACI92E_001666 [Oceanicoccus sp.]|jgi:hypothetical protein